MNSTYSKDDHIMHLIRILVFLAAHFDFWFIARHIEGKANRPADDLSCNNFTFSLRFFKQSTTHHTHSIWTFGHPSQRLDIHRLDQAVLRYYQAALTPSTHKTYKPAENRYLTFCNNFSLSLLLASENILCYFAACLGHEGLAYSSIRTYLSGIPQIHIAAGYPDPSINQMPRLRQIIKGIRVLAARSGKILRPRLPITPSIQLSYICLNVVTKLLMFIEDTLIAIIHIACMGVTHW